MLTSGQCVIAAYLTDGDILCPDCAAARLPVTMEQLYEGAKWAMELNEDAPLSHREKWECADWARETFEALEEKAGIRPIIQYTLDSEFAEGGANCGECGCVLVEDEDAPEVDVEDYDAED